jgi:hypothetical protein
VDERQSHIDEVMNEEMELVAELHKQQEEIVRQVKLAEHKPAWDAALREVVDLAFAFGSTLPEVSEAILTLTLTLALTLTLIQTLTPNPNQVSEVIVEQLLEGAHLAS